MSKFVGTGPSFYKKGIYRVVVPQRLRNAAVEDKTSAWFLEDAVLNVLLRQTFMVQVFFVVSEMWSSVTLCEGIFLPFPLVNYQKHENFFLHMSYKFRKATLILSKFIGYYV